MTAPTLEEMQTARNRLIRLHRIPTDAAVAIDADHLIVTLARVEDYDRLRAELRLHALATYMNRQTGLVLRKPDHPHPRDPPRGHPRTEREGRRMTASALITDTATVPDDASTLAEQCYARLYGEDCPLPAAWWVLLACPACDLTGLRAHCDEHTAGMRRRETRGAVTRCCHVPVRVTVVEAL